MFPRLAVLLFCLSLLCPTSTLADKWVELRSPNFTLVSNAGEKDTRQIAAELEQIRAILSQAIDSPRGEGAPITVIVTDSEELLRSLMVPSGKSIAGWDVLAMAAASPDKYYLAIKPLHPTGARTSSMYTPTSLPINPLPFQIYAGRFVRLSYGLLPLWLDVGLKQFYGSTALVKDEIRVGAMNPHRQDSVYTQKMFPLETLLSATRETVMDVNSAEQFKNQSEALVHFLTFADNLPKRRPIREITDLIRQGTDSVEAVQKSVGDLKQLQRKLQAYLRKEEQLQAPVPSPAPANVRDLPLRDVPAAEVAALLGDFLQCEWWESYVRKQPESYSIYERGRTVPEARGRMQFADVPAVPLSAAESVAFVGNPELPKERLNRARSYLEEAARLDPNLLVVQTAIGWRYSRDGNLPAAREWLQKAVTAHPQSHVAHYYLARMLAEEPDSTPEMVTRTQTAFRRAIALQPRFAPAYDGLAKSMERTGKLEEATRLSHRSLELDLSNPSYFLTISRVLLKTGQADLARLAARQAVAGSENEAERQEAQAILTQAVARLAAQPAAAPQSAKQPPQ